MMHDFRWAVRWLRRNPLFATAVVAILGLGIGASTAAFSITDAVLLRPSVDRAGRSLMRVEEKSTKRAMFGMPAKDYLRWRDRSDLFQTSAPFVRDMVTLGGIDTPDQMFAIRTEGRLFTMLGARAAVGRALLETDDDAGDVVVIADRLWERVFHRDPWVVGRHVVIADQPYTIVGVMPPTFEFPTADVEMWIAMRLTPTQTRVECAAVLRPGVPPEAVQSAMRIVAHQLEEEEPIEKAGLEIVVSPWQDDVTRRYTLSVVFIVAAVGLVLLIACTDAGSLLLCRALQRQREIAIRASLGADAWRVARQLLAESLVLATLGTVAGLAAARWTLHGLVRYLAALPIAIPHLQGVALNGRVLAANTALCMVLACALSLLPVLLARRADLQTALRTGQGGGARRGSTRTFSILIGVEAAFAFLLLVGSGLMMHSLIRLEKSDNGFRPDHVLTLRVPVGSITQPRPGTKYDTKPRQMAHYQQLLDRLKQVPGVRYAAFVNNPPLTSVNTTTDFVAPDGSTRGVPTRCISEEYFAAMGIPLLAGRTFTAADQSMDAPLVGIIDQHMARTLLAGRDPLEEVLRVNATRRIRIVGVVKDAAQMVYGRPPKDEMYIPFRQYVFGVFMSTIVVRASGQPLAIASAVRRAVWEVDPEQPIVKLETLNDMIADSIWQPRFSAWVYSALGVLALLLTSAGIYSVVSFTTTLRTREMGLRVALGATPATVVAGVLRGTMLPLACGLGASLIAARLLVRLMASLLYETSQADPAAYGFAVLILLGTGLLASIRPAWKAATRDPLEALRSE
jgi:putative ABC transport system permease protein